MLLFLEKNKYIVSSYREKWDTKMLFSLIATISTVEKIAMIFNFL